MPAQTWTTPEQRSYLLEEDSNWLVTKKSGGSLKGFYARTAAAFLTKWPAVPDKATLEKANGDEAVAKQEAEKSVLGVSVVILVTSMFSHHTW